MKMEPDKSDKGEEKQSIKQIEDKTLNSKHQTPETDSFSESCDLSTQLIGGDDIPKLMIDFHWRTEIRP